MTITARVVSVGTTPTLLSSGTTSDLRAGSRVTIRPDAAISIGGADVTTAAGFPVAAAAPFSDTLEPGDQLYAVVVGPGSVNVNVYEGGL